METAEPNFLNAKGNLVSSESSLSQAKSSLDSSKVDLSYAIIRSPIDGVVINRAVNLGQTVAASYQAPVLFKLASDLTKMQLQCDIDETDIGKVKEGQKVRFTVSAYQGETFIGTVQQVRYSPQTVQNVVTYTTIVERRQPRPQAHAGHDGNRLDHHRRSQRRPQASQTPPCGSLRPCPRPSSRSSSAPTLAQRGGQGGQRQGGQQSGQAERPAPRRRPGGCQRRRHDP